MLVDEALWMIKDTVKWQGWDTEKSLFDVRIEEAMWEIVNDMQQINA